VLVNELGAGKIDASSVHDGPGTYYLGINSECSWTVHVVTSLSTGTPNVPDATPTAPVPSSPPTTELVYSVSGSGIKDTPTFTVPTPDWTLAYAYDCTDFGGSGNFAVTLYKSGELDTVLVNELGAGKIDASSVHDGPGTYYLGINSECNWTVHVVT
jgi:hypothetical protein